MKFTAEYAKKLGKTPDTSMLWKQLEKAIREGHTEVSIYLPEPNKVQQFVFELNFQGFKVKEKDNLITIVW